MRTLSIQNAMTKNLICIQWNASMQEACTLMEDRRIRHLPVKNEQGYVIGILSDRDVKRAMNPTRESFHEGLLVGDYMSWPVADIDQHASIAEVAEGMIDEKISAFLVTSSEQILGIVTSEDLLQLLAKMLREQTSSQASKLSSLSYQPLMHEAIRELNSAGI